MHKTRMINTVVGAITLALTGTASASDAVLSSIDGVALVNKGDSYVTAQEQTALGVGDRVMVMEGGSATITYADGCSYTLGDSQVLTISNESPCGTEQTASQEIGKRYAEAAGAGAAAAWIPIAGGGLIAVAAIASDDDGDISPQ